MLDAFSLVWRLWLTLVLEGVNTPKRTKCSVIVDGPCTWRILWTNLAAFFSCIVWRGVTQNGRMSWRVRVFSRRSRVAATSGVRMTNCVGGAAITRNSIGIILGTLTVRSKDTVLVCIVVGAIEELSGLRQLSVQRWNHVGQRLKSMVDDHPILDGTLQRLCWHVMSCLLHQFTLHYVTVQNL